MAGNNYDLGGPVANINVTPLVDVMLVLLVIFMVTAPMLQQGVEVNLPKATTAPLKGANEQIVLSIDSKGNIYLGAKNRVALDNLDKKLNAIFKARNDHDRKVYIKADAALQYGRIMEVMGVLHRGGITQIGLVSAPAEKKIRR
ncbi:MAG: protein TolR [Candidatus Dadabacteria bacterium]|nr:MAG: protein TolR [Candidatus Dadabacteria bacterium]